jgi:hypothetical protein
LLAATLFFNAVSTPVELIAMSKGIANGMGWVTVATRVIIETLCIYFLFTERKSKKCMQKINSTKIFIDTYQKLLYIFLLAGNLVFRSTKIVPQGGVYYAMLN